MAGPSFCLLAVQEPIDTSLTNVTANALVLDAARRRLSLEAIVVVTSDKCDENHEWPWPYRETDALVGADPYSASKGCTEIVANSFRRSYFSAPGEIGRASCRERVCQYV